MGFGEWASYVPAAKRRRLALREIARMKKAGKLVSPVILEGRKIAANFWGKAWCDNLESYRDYAHRLERGRTYVRNGSVIDLQIVPHEIRAKVMGSELYVIRITIKALPAQAWKAICIDCAGRVESLVELLQGRLSKAVMERVCRQGEGLFPKPADIKFSCSCPDSASMCKHIAATLYGAGARFDAEPELLFRLRALDASEMFANLDASVPVSKGDGANRLSTSNLSDIFGLDMAVLDRPLTDNVLATAKATHRKSTSTAQAKVVEPAKIRTPRSKAIQHAEIYLEKSMVKPALCGKRAGQQKTADVQTRALVPRFIKSAPPSKDIKGIRTGVEQPSGGQPLELERPRDGRKTKTAPHEGQNLSHTREPKRIAVAAEPGQGSHKGEAKGLLAPLRTGKVTPRSKVPPAADSKVTLEAAEKPRQSAGTTRARRGKSPDVVEMRPVKNNSAIRRSKAGNAHPPGKRVGV